MGLYLDLSSVAIYTVILILSWITVLARVWVKCNIVKTFAVEDWLMVSTLGCLTVICVLVIYMAGKGLGQHSSELTDAELSSLLKTFYFAEVGYIVSTMTLKLSITALLLRLAVQKRYRLILQGTGILYSACGVIFTFIISFQCYPQAMIWDPTIQGHCIYRPTFANLIQVNAAISLITDLIFALVPIALIWNTQMDWGTKFSIGFVLSLGISVSGVDIARFKYIPALASPYDSSYKLWPLALTSILEVGIGTIAASLTTLRPLLRSVADKVAAQKSPQTHTTKSNAPLIDQERVGNLTKPIS